jgi:hypothetical protein
MEEMTPNEAINKLWKDWALTDNERNLLTVIGMLLVRIEDLEKRLTRYQSNLGNDDIS